MSLSPAAAAQIKQKLLESLAAPCPSAVQSQLAFSIAASSALLLAYVVALGFRISRSRPRSAGFKCFKVLQRSSGTYYIPVGMAVWTKSVVWRYRASRLLMIKTALFGSSTRVRL